MLNVLFKRARRLLLMSSRVGDVGVVQATSVIYSTDNVQPEQLRVEWPFPGHSARQLSQRLQGRIVCLLSTISVVTDPAGDIPLFSADGKRLICLCSLGQDHA